MKIHDAAREIERHDISVESKFTIRATGKAFRILSSALYKDKILAVIRELSCNAYDAHVAAGCPEKPFFVHLPNSLEPFFSVRDEGIGLSPEDIESIYTTYFSSTKTDSNDYIGALGLGSKSPFSYVDSFSVRSIYSGIQYNYAAFIAENGEPSLVLMSKMPTLECNGIEVSMPVKYNNDFIEFVQKAKTVLSRFKTKPIISGNVGFEFHEFTPLVTGDRWILVNPLSNGYGAVALMGQVAYPISSDAINSLPQSIIKLYECSIQIEFPIGSLDVTAGREELSYDRNTLKALEDRAQEIIADAPSVFSKEISRFDTERAARSWFDRIASSHITGLFINSKPNFIFKDKIIDTLYFFIAQKDIGSLEIVSYCESYSKYSKTILNEKSTSPNVAIDPSYYTTTTIAIDDMGSKGKTRINYRRRYRSEERLHIFSGNKEEIEGFIKNNLDGFEPILVSSFDKPERKPSVSKPLNKLRKIVLVYHRLDYKKKNSNLWQYEDFDPSVGGIYVEKQVYSPYYKNQLDYNFFSKMKHAVNILPMEDIKVYGFNYSEAKKYGALGNWIELNEYIKQKVQKFFDDSNIANLKNLTSLNNVYPSVNKNKRILENISNYLSDKHLVRDFSHNIGQPSFVPDMKYIAGCYLADHYKINVDIKTDWNIAWRKIITKYPLLSIINGETNDKIDIQSFVGYINWIDSKTA